MKAYITKILNLSAVDGPGNRMVFFFQGCNLNCTFCHNPETIKIHNSNDDTKKILTLEIKDVLDKVRQVKPFISGVTISGGECTVQYDFMLELAKTFKKEGISLYIDTNGFLPTEKMNELSKFADKFMLDIKAVNLEEHIKITGYKNDLILENLDLLAKNNKLYEVRSVIVPDEIENEVTVRYVSNKLMEYNSEIRYKLIQFRKHGVRQPYSENYKSPSYEYMNNLKKIAESYGLCNVIIT